MNVEENDLFQQAMAMDNVRPLRACSEVHWSSVPAARTRRAEKAEPLENFLSQAECFILPLDQPLAFRAVGIQQGVLDKLKRGKYRPEASLSLLRQPVESCRQMLFSFMLRAQQEGLRNILIIHGKGREQGSHPNIIRSYLARWLTQFDGVQVFCVARPQHGGSGALYVGLRKSALAKSENREQYARRKR